MTFTDVIGHLENGVSVTSALPREYRSNTAGGFISFKIYVMCHVDDVIDEAVPEDQ